MSQTAFELDTVFVGEGSPSKRDVLDELADQAASVPSLQTLGKKTLREAFAKREKVGSTAFGGGLAIPHCVFPSIERFAIGVLLYPEGVDFTSLDGKPTHLFFYIVAPQSQRNRHVNILSAISRTMQEAQVLEKILALKDPQELRHFLEAKLQRDEHSWKEDRKYYQLMIYVQKEEYFNEILEELSTDIEGSLVVLEAYPSRYYLHKIPLFSALWTGGEVQFSRLIVAIVPQSFLNNAVRRINALVPQKEEGVLITAQELTLCSGHLEF